MERKSEEAKSALASIGGDSPTLTEEEKASVEGQ